jgi:hypothetical protein
VTGVQTCALPIFTLELPREMAEFRRQVFDDLLRQLRPDPS